MGLVCPMCKEEYATSGERQPRLLVGCGHTFCQSCLDAECGTGSNEEGVTCPQCSHVTKDPPVPNITIMNYVAAMKVQPEATVRHPLPAPQKSLCQNCRKELASYICFQCLPTGFMFCASCCEREHSRPFGPVKGHKPKAIGAVRINTPVPMCQTHPNKPCLLFSSVKNKFACEQCNQSGVCVVEDCYIPIEQAVEAVRNDVPSLMQLIRDKVDAIVKTRTELDSLLKRVDQEKMRALDRVNIEFNTLEVALKKRLSEITGLIEEEAHFQKKSLLEQQERLELAQGNADTAIVRGNWLLQMTDYTHLQQAENTLARMKAQLSDEDLPLYQAAVTTGEIPVYLPLDLLNTIETLGCIGGGRVPSRLRTEISCGLLMLKWEQTASEAAEKYEIRYEPVEENSDPVSMVTGDYSNYKRDFPRSIDSIPASVSQKLISGIMPRQNYCFRIRSQNIAGWGVWSRPIVGAMPGFPLTIEYTGEIVELEIPSTGHYQITARGAKAADGETKRGGHGGIIEAIFKLEKYDKLIILCGGMSERVLSSTGGGGGTFVSLQKRSQCLIVAGGGGGTRGHDSDDFDGRDANTNSSEGLDGLGQQWAEGGAGGGAGKDANFSGPCWGYGGAGFSSTSSKSQSFISGGAPGPGGGFGGGGAVGMYGGGGGGGYSGGGGGRGGGGGGSFVRDDGENVIRNPGNTGHGSVTIVEVSSGQ